MRAPSLALNARIFTRPASFACALKKSTRRASSSTPPSRQKWDEDWCSRPVSALPADRVDSLMSKFDEALSCSAAGGSWARSRSVLRSSNATAAADNKGPAVSEAPQTAPGAAAAAAAAATAPCAVAATAAAEPSSAVAAAPPSSTELADTDAPEERTVLAAFENVGVPMAATVRGKSGRSAKKGAAPAEGGNSGDPPTGHRDGAKPSRKATQPALLVSSHAATRMKRS